MAADSPSEGLPDNKAPHININPGQNPTSLPYPATNPPKPPPSSPRGL